MSTWRDDVDQRRSEVLVGKYEVVPSARLTFRMRLRGISLDELTTVSLFLIRFKTWEHLNQDAGSDRFAEQRFVHSVS